MDDDNHNINLKSKKIGRELEKGRLIYARGRLNTGSARYEFMVLILVFCKIPISHLNEMWRNMVAKTLQYIQRTRIHCTMKQMVSFLPVT